MRTLLLAAALFLCTAAPAFAGGPYMWIGSAEDVAKAQDPAFSKLEMDKAKLAGFDTVRLTETWVKGQRAVGPTDRVTLGNAIKAAQFTGLRIVLSIFPYGSSVTPLTDQDRNDFAAFCVDIAERYPSVSDFIIGNEPNLNRFWLPQFDSAGNDVAAQEYEALLAVTYDALKAARPHSTIFGGALAPRGVDKPNTGRDTHSPTAFITDMGNAYKTSGRQLPIMDAFAFHPYPETSTIGPNFPHPYSTSIGLADYTKLVTLLGTAFDGTAQHGSSLPILYDEFGIETQIPANKALLYTGTEPSTTKPVTETVQGEMYLEAMQMVFCQPTVMGLFLFHVQDEPALAAWQSGEFYVDGTPKSSLGPVRSAAFGVRRGIVTACPDLQLTPKIVLKAAKPKKTTETITLTCTLDCTFRLQLDGGRAVTGAAIGKTPKKLVFHVALKKGRHTVTATAATPVNTGPPGSAALTFKA